MSALLHIYVFILKLHSPLGLPIIHLINCRGYISDKRAGFAVLIPFRSPSLDILAFRKSEKMAYQAITSFKTTALYTLALWCHGMRAGNSYLTTFFDANCWRFTVTTALSLINALDSNTIANPAIIEIRAQPAAPDGYSPADGNCPSARPVIRTATKLSTNESSWLEQRRGKTVGPMRDLLGRINIAGFDAAAFISDHAQNFSALPNIAVAVSGGGYRAMLNGGERLYIWHEHCE